MRGNCCFRARTIRIDVLGSSLYLVVNYFIMDLLSEVSQWALTSKAQQDEVVDNLLSNLKGFEIVYEKDYCLESPIRIISINDVATKIVFNLIPCGTFAIRFSQAEEQQFKTLSVSSLYLPQVNKRMNAIAFIKNINNYCLGDRKSSGSSSNPQSSSSC